MKQDKRRVGANWGQSVRALEYSIEKPGFARLTGNPPVQCGEATESDPPVSCFRF